MPPKKKTPSAARAKRKTAAKASTKVKGVGKKVGKAAATVAKRASKIDVHKTATRAKEMGDSVVTAGELLKEAAGFVDSIAQRAKTRPKKTR